MFNGPVQHMAFTVCCWYHPPQSNGNPCPLSNSSNKLGHDQCEGKKREGGTIAVFHDTIPVIGIET